MLIRLPQTAISLGVFRTRFVVLVIIGLAVAGCSDDGTGGQHTVSGYVRFATGKTNHVGTYLGTIEVERVDGVPVELVSNGLVVGSTRTSAGRYELTGIYPGRYNIRSRMLPGYVFTTKSFEVNGANVTLTDTLQIGPAGNISAAPNPFWSSTMISFYAFTEDTLRLDLYSANYSYLKTLHRFGGRTGSWGSLWNGSLDDDSEAPDGAYWITLSGNLQAQDWMTATINGWVFAGPRTGGVQVLPLLVIYAENPAEGFELQGELNFEYPEVGIQESFRELYVEIPSGRYAIGPSGFGTYTLSQFDDTRVVGSLDALLFKTTGPDSIRVTGTFEADPYAENSLQLTVNIDGDEVQSTFGYEYFLRHSLLVSSLDWDFELNQADYFGCSIQICIQQITEDFVRTYAVGSGPREASANVSLRSPKGYTENYHGVSGCVTIEENDPSEWSGVKSSFSFLAANEYGDTLVVSNGTTNPQGPSRPERRVEHQLLVKDSSYP